MTETTNSELQSFKATVVGEPQPHIHDAAIGMITVRVEATSGEREVILHHRDGLDGGIAFEDGVLTLSGSPLTYLLRVLEADRMDVELRDHENDTIRGATRIGKWWVSMCGMQFRCYLPWTYERMGLEIARKKDGSFKSAKLHGKKITEEQSKYWAREFGSKPYITATFSPEKVGTSLGSHTGMPSQEAREDVRSMIRDAAAL